MSNHKWMRSVSFNTKNEQDKKRLDFIGKKSFSKLIKSLLDAEIERKQLSKQPVQQEKSLVASTTSKPSTPLQPQRKEPVATSKTVVTKPAAASTWTNPMLAGRKQ